MKDVKISNHAEMREEQIRDMWSQLMESINDKGVVQMVPGDRGKNPRLAINPCVDKLLKINDTLLKLEAAQDGQLELEL